MEATVSVEFDYLTCANGLQRHVDDHGISSCRVRTTMFGDVYETPSALCQFPLILSAKHTFSGHFFNSSGISDLLDELSDSIVAIELLDTSQAPGVCIARYEAPVQSFLYPRLSLTPSYSSLRREVDLNFVSTMLGSVPPRLILQLSVDVRSLNENSEESLQNTAIRLRKKAQELALEIDDMSTARGTPHMYAGTSTNEREERTFGFSGTEGRRRSYTLSAVDKVIERFPLAAAFIEEDLNLSTYMRPTTAAIFRFEQDFPLHRRRQRRHHVVKDDFPPFCLRKCDENQFERLPTSFTESPPYDHHGGTGPRSGLPGCDKYWMLRSVSLPRILDTS